MILFVKVHHLKILSVDSFNFDGLTRDRHPLGKVATDLWPGASPLSSVQSSEDWDFASWPEKSSPR
jgi:hypothetical protein